MHRSHDDLQLDRRRDNQQWALDYLIQATGREQNFEVPGRRFPPEVKSHAMIPRVMYRYGRQKEELARRAEAAGHVRTAIDLYHGAVEDYRFGQHAIYADDHPDKLHIYGRLEACYDRIVDLAEGRIERVEVDWEGQQLSGILHLAPVDGPAPAVVYCPGMDRTKESFPAPGDNPYAARGMHLLAIDGPGQGVSNIRKIRVTADNYERGAQRFLDHLVGRPDVDADRIGVSGASMGSFWGTRLAALDDRVKAVATAVACYGSKRAIFQQSSPRFKQVFMYMAGIDHEEEFDRMAAEMTLVDEAGDITCPVLMAMGEYDPLCPLDEAYDVFERLPDPKEIWVLEDAFHNLRSMPHLGGLDIDPLLADWLSDTLNARVDRSGARRVLMHSRGTEGPYGGEVDGFWLADRDRASGRP